MFDATVDVDGGRPHRRNCPIDILGRQSSGENDRLAAVDRERHRTIGRQLDVDLGAQRLRRGGGVWVAGWNPAI